MDRMVSVNSSANEATVSHNEQDAGHSAVQAQKAVVAAAQPNAQQAHAAPSQPARSVPTEAELAAVKVAAANAAAETEEVLAQLAEDAEKDKEELQLAIAEEAEADAVETAEFTATVPAIDLTSGLTTVQFAQAGMPARQGVDGASSLGQDDDGDAGISGVLIGVLALAAIGGGIAVAAGGGGNKDSDLPSNSPPVAGDDTLAATEGSGTVNLSVTANDSDPDGNALTYTANGTLPVGVTLSAAGAVTFDSNNAEYNSLAAGATRALTFSYTVNDGNGGTDTANVTLTVTGTNDAPVAVADTAAATEDAPAVTGSVATNDSDVDAGTTLTYALAAPVAGLTLNANGTYSFDPSNAAYQPLAAGATQVVVANYTVSDGAGGTANSTLTITLTGVNDAPVAVADVATATEDGAVVTGSVATNDSDVDNGAVLTYALVGTAPAGVTLNADGSYSFDPSVAAYQSLALGETSDVVVSYTVTDENGATATSTLTITVTGVNDAPVAVADVATATEDAAPMTGSVATNDSDVDNGAVLTYTLDAAVDGLTLNADGSYSFDPSDAAYQSLAVGETTDVVASYTVTDENGATSTSTLTITVTGVNDAPVAVADVATAIEDGPDVTGSVATNDSDVDASDVLTYTLAAPVAGLTLNADGTYTFDTSDPAYQSLRTDATQVVVANYTVSDGNGGTADSTLTITITGTNDAPVITSPTTGLVSENAPNTTVVYDADATDVDDGDTLTYTIGGDDADAFNIDAATGEVRLNAPANFERQTSYSITVTATDNGNPVLSATQAVTIAVADEIDVLSIDDLGEINDPLVINAGIQTGDVTDTNFQFTDTAGAFTEVSIVDFGANDFFFFEGSDPSDYDYFTDANGDLVIARQAGDGTTNLITLLDVFDGLPAQSISNEAEAEAALAEAFGLLEGDFFRGSADPVAVSSTGTAAFDASGKQATITEDLSNETSIVIDNFRGDDSILFINLDGSADEIFVRTGDDDARDLVIEYVDATTQQVSQIILNDVLDPNSPIPTTLAEAEAVLDAQFGAGDYFQFG